MNYLKVARKLLCLAVKSKNEYRMAFGEHRMRVYQFDGGHWDCSSLPTINNFYSSEDAVAAFLKYRRGDIK